MKKVVVATYIPFWMQNAGFCARLYSMIRYLTNYVEVTVVFAGTNMENDFSVIRSLPFRFNLVYFDKSKLTTIDEYRSAFRELFKSGHFDVCIIEYVDLSFLLDCIPPATKVFLDTHDIMFQRHRSFAAFDSEQESRKYSIVNYTEEEELELFNRYNAVIFINTADYHEVRNSVDLSKIIIAPHPPDLSRKEQRKKAVNISFVGSAYYPNVDAIRSFVQEVWPGVVAVRDVCLNVYGNVSGCVKDEPGFDLPGVKVHGFVDRIDSIYGNSDIIINPVRIGSGIKIKNMEAMANGLPLVTTSHGARGLEPAASVAFVVANSPEDWTRNIIELIDSYELRLSYGENAFRFISNEYTPEKCFSALLDRILA